MSTVRHIVLLIALALVWGAGCKKKDDLVLQNNDPNQGGPPVGQDGSACTSDRRCDGETCLGFGSGWHGGYCTTLDCAQAGCNGDDSQCIEFLDGSSFCLDGCDQNADCRNGYRCRALDASGRNVCYRDDGDGPPAGSVGSDCANDDDCVGELTCDTSVPGGYCLGSCEDCSRDATCAPWNGADRCVGACETTRDCRTGYLCDDGVCAPGDAVIPPFDFAVTEDVLGIECGAEEMGEEDFGVRWRLTYDVPAGVPGYTVVPFVRTGGLRPLEIGLPSGEILDLVRDYRHHNIRVTEFQFFDQESEGVYGEVALDWPILVPYTPDRIDLLQTGTHTLDVITSIGEPCIYVLAAEPDGITIDINVIFMGLEGYTAESAPNDPDLSEVFARVDEILAPAGVGVGSVRFYDAPREIAERYAHIRDEIEMRRATAFGAPRSESLDGHLNVDMFLVEDLRLGGGALVLGLSAGLPGPPGLHGNPANGLVFTGADIGSENEFVAHIMAHELGHYVGLRHTTEVLHNHEQGVELNFVLGTTDPIEDTPICDSVLFQQANCPDFTNLMFPSAPEQTFIPVITDGQSAVLRANPLFKPAE